MNKVFEIRIASEMTEEERFLLDPEEKDLSKDEFERAGRQKDWGDKDLAVVIYKGKIVDILEEYPDRPRFNKDLADYLEAIEQAFALGVSHGIDSE